jgi:hypothetical protein
MKLHVLLLTLLFGTACAQEGPKIRLESFGEDAAKNTSPEEIKSYLENHKVLYAAKFFEEYKKNFLSDYDSVRASHMIKDHFLVSTGNGHFITSNNPHRKFNFSIDSKRGLDITFRGEEDLSDGQNHIDFLISKGLYETIPNHPCKCTVDEENKKGTIECQFTFDVTNKDDNALLEKALFADRNVILAAFLGEEKQSTNDKKQN